MATSTRLQYTVTAPIGGKLIADAVKNLISAKAQLDRAMAVANALTGGGVTPANLEGSAEFFVATGQGSAFYTAINNMKANLAPITLAALADLDPGG